MSSLRIISLVLLVGLVTVDRSARAQDAADTAALERSIGGEGGSFNAIARARLIRALRTDDAAAAEPLLRLMARRDPTWLSAEERLCAGALLVDTALLRAPARLEALFAAAEREEFRGNPAYPDDALRTMRDLVRARAGGLFRTLQERGAAPVERQFFTLFVNRCYIRGYRAHEDLNGLVSRFSAEYPGSPEARLAERYIRSDYREEPIGGGFSAGYGVGRFTGKLDDRFSYVHGPAFSGELYLWSATASASFMFGAAHIGRSFRGGNGVWPAGNAQLACVNLELGYEFRWGRLAVTPMAGLAVTNLTAPSDAAVAEAPRTGDRLGLGIGVIGGYRIPSDVGPHIDLRVRAGSAGGGLSGYDPGFAGSLWYVQIGFALVQRPYRGR